MNEKGQTLIEVVVGLATLVVIIGAIAATTITSLYSEEFSKNQRLATSYAQQGIETIRNMRDVDIASISAQMLPDGTYCLAKGCTALIQSNTNCWKPITTCSQNIDIFVREVQIDHASAQCDSASTGDVQATSQVSWYDTKCTDRANLYCHTVSVSTCLSDFTVAPTQ